MDPLKKFYEEHYSKIIITSHMKKRVYLTIDSIKNNLSSFETILEIGCGTGENLALYRDYFNFKKTYCIEIADNALNSINEKGIIPFIEDINKDEIPLDDESIDIVIFQEVIEHLYNSDLVMKEIYRVLRKNGLLILSTPNLSSWINRITLALGYQPFSHDVSFIAGFGRIKYKNQTNGHIKSFTLRAMIEYLKYYNFSLIKIKGVEADGINSKLVELIDKTLSRFPSLASHMFVVAKKT
ncbi:class I SAM-dependent methyltransferase [Metallosphaera javensis (ex Sakai et al. 2022)]|uniref:class I SAM-dependent methyltransferase n=1 Tax=Metallosphaera javensis (ex Sakai et al. 2022) TaxID=2775498 RepID=UPI00258AD62D|nr:MAG: ubiquinone biosynthesis O-methyltransferase [Metallosphaera javensis (ex Sakai et al. 2022)]